MPPRLPFSLNAGPRRTRSRVRGADPLSPGSAETSRGRSRAGTGTRPPARVRGRRNCLGRPRDPQHARDRASTRGRLPASNPHRTFPVFEDHHDRGALSPRACDHSRGRGQRAKPASSTSGPVESGRESRTVGPPLYLTQIESWVLSRRTSPSRRTSGGAATAVLAVGLLKTGAIPSTPMAVVVQLIPYDDRGREIIERLEEEGTQEQRVEVRKHGIRRVQPPGQEPGHGRVRRDAQPHRFGLARAPRANLATACRVRGKTPAAVRPTLGAHASASLAIVLSALGYRHLSLSLHPLVESTGRLSCGVGRLAFSPAESRLRLRRPSATYNPEGSNSAPSIGAQALIRL